MGLTSTEQVAVVGLGLIGGSLARALAEQGVDVRGYDASAVTCAQATAAGVRVASGIDELCAAAPQVVVLAVPLRAMRATAHEVARYLPATAVVTDVGSVKAAVRSAVAGAGLGDRYVGAHPMAGTEHSGFAASDPDLLVGARWAVTLDEDTCPDHLATVLRLVTGPLGGTAYVLTDDVHDEAAALVSHVPHVLATQLLNLVATAPISDVAVALAAGSFRDGTRVGRTDPRRTEAMVTENAPWVASALRVVLRDLEALVAALESNASTAEFFDRAQALRTSGDSRDVHPRASVTLGEPGWRDTLTSLGAAGRPVVGVDEAGERLVVH
ncbi:prephenate dehydrogenase [Oerskovia flava]|uniref:prephenate dehydrogenase n=1 Tax=Oerskovia flava TaxID=2986422 RepID=UPI00224031BB|nr:prephenate dehydrogenase/arogenate dehydrogenase family protein [Oerskovia sp. JB1-3-2]